MIKKLKLFGIFGVILLLNACAMSMPKEVYIPIKCDAQKRDRPPKTKDITIYLKSLLIYTEILESDLAYCRGEFMEKQE